MTWDLGRDLSHTFDDLGTVPVVIGGVTTRGYLDEGEVLEDNGQGVMVKIAETALGLPTAIAATLTFNQQITADGRQWLVREPRRLGDGKITQVLLVAVT